MKDKIPDLFCDKSVLVKSVDGGPDENPRFSKNIIMSIKTFQVYNIWKYNTL